MRKIILLCLAVLLALGGCAGPETAPTDPGEAIDTTEATFHDRSHRLIEVKYKVPAEYETGNYLYYRCSDCGALFKDFTGRTPTTWEEVEVPALGSIPFALHDHDGTPWSLTRLDSYYGHAAQGSAIYEDTFFVCNKYGRCFLYDLESGSKIAEFPLGSYDDSDAPSQNHCNQMMFGPEKFDPADPYPLLYVTIGYSNDHDPTGAYWCKASVERIRQDAAGQWYAEIVQTIEFNDADNIPDEDPSGILTQMYQDGKFLYVSGNGYDAAAGYEKIGYGWPHFYVDPSPTEATAGKLILFSTRFRGSEHWENQAIQDYGITSHTDDNAFIFTTLELPALPRSEADAAYGATVTLYPRDILDQFTAPYTVYAFQGGTMYQGKIFHSFGDGRQTEKHTNAICIWDVAQRRQLALLDLRSSILAEWEPECCCIYDGELALSTYNMDSNNPTVNLYLFGYVDAGDGQCLMCGTELEK